MRWSETWAQGSTLEFNTIYYIDQIIYWAGHRYISSTERYVQDDLENLQEAIESLHPIS